MRLLSAAAVLLCATAELVRSDATDDAYDAYFERMRQYAAQIEKQQFMSMEARHERERQAMIKRFEEYHKGDEAWEAEAGQTETSTPSDPFGGGGGKAKEEDDGDLWERRRRAREGTATGGRKRETARVPMEELCKRFAHTATFWCRGSTTDRHAARCWQYFQDCGRLVPANDPLFPMVDIYKALPKPAKQESTSAAETEARGLIEDADRQQGFIPERGSSSGSPPGSRVIPRQKLNSACKRVLPTARRYCHGWKNTFSDMKRSCTAFLISCTHLIQRNDPLYNVAKEAEAQGISGSSGMSGSDSKPPPKFSKSDIEEAEKEAALAKTNLPPAAVDALKRTCDRFLPSARKHCKGAQTEEKFARRCRGYAQDCSRFFAQADPLAELMRNDGNMGVGLNLGSWAVKGIPFYPINEEGAIGSGFYANIPFGAWGGGYSQNIGVRDYWSQFFEVGANWYEGKYGYKSGWTVPLVQSLGIEGDTHAVVSVPLKPGDFGKPIGVDVGGGVGPYYQQNQHVGVDWMDGQVNSNFGVAVPIGGVGVNTGVGVAFPGASTWLG